MERNLAIIGVVIQLFFVFALLVSIFFLYETYMGLVNGTISPDPELLKAELASDLVPGFLILMVGVIGLVISFVILVFNKYRENWYYWSTMILAIPYIIFFPLGTIFSISIMIYLVANRKEFGAPNKALQATAYSGA